MTEHSISIPPAMLDWLQQLVAEGKYVDVGDYLRDLLCRELEDSGKIARLREQIAGGGIWHL
jgi:Arc/MetJ-type ribon-helix-helix transcriptional regulator